MLQMDEKLVRTSETASSPEELELEAGKVENEEEILPRKRKITSEIDRPDDLKRFKLVKNEEEDSYDEKTPIKRKTHYSPQKEPTITESIPLDVWTAQDDFSLITAVFHVSCLRYVHKVLPFSRDFSYSDLEERLCQLMYDNQHSRLARARMSALDARQKLRISSRTPFTRAEENFLLQSGDQLVSGITGMVPKQQEPEHHHNILKLEHFKSILEKNREKFHPARTPQILSDHYRRIKRFKDEQEHNLEAPIDTDIDSVDFYAPLQACQERFHEIQRKPALRSIQLGFKTCVIPDTAIATIHGQFVQFSMINKTAIIGRASSTERVDVDLSKEGPAVKVSRQQAIIRQTPDFRFIIQNIGQRAMYIDGKPLPQMVSTTLEHGSIIEVASLRLIFSIPTPRPLHPITRQIALQHKKAEPPVRAHQPYQQYPKVVKKGRPPGQTKNASSMHSVVRRADPAEKERLLKAVAGIGGGQY